jgi:hypothetical protein
MKWMVEHNFAGGWDDSCWATEKENGESIPMRFDTEAEANKEIADFIHLTEMAFKTGTLAEAYSKEDFRAVPVMEKGEPLPLVEGAHICVQCGYCCKKALCPYGTFDASMGHCVELERNTSPNLTYRCKRYKEIIDGDNKTWHFSPAFGAGCCSPMNSDRLAILKG